VAVPTILYGSDMDIKKKNNNDIKIQAAEMHFSRIVKRCTELSRKEVIC
jgi:hypothetical protein